MVVLKLPLSHLAIGQGNMLLFDSDFHLILILFDFDSTILWLEYVYVYPIQALEGGPSFSP